jgi:hypothetical protein
MRLFIAPLKNCLSGQAAIACSASLQLERSAIKRMRSSEGGLRPVLSTKFSRRNLRNIAKRSLQGSHVPTRSRPLPSEGGRERSVAACLQVGAGSFQQSFFGKKSGIFEKDLAPRREADTVSPPFDKRLPEKIGGWYRRRQRSINLQFSPKVFRKFPGKELTERRPKFLLKLFP